MLKAEFFWNVIQSADFSQKCDQTCRKNHVDPLEVFPAPPQIALDGIKLQHTAADSLIAS